MSAPKISAYEHRAVQAAIIIAVLAVIVLLLTLPGCVGAYRMREPLGPVKTDPLPVCDAQKGKCVRT